MGHMEAAARRDPPGVNSMPRVACAAFLIVLLGSCGPLVLERRGFVDYWIDNQSSAEYAVGVTYPSGFQYVFIVPPETHGILVQWEGSVPSGFRVMDPACEVLRDVSGLGNTAGLIIGPAGEVSVREGVGVPFSDAKDLESSEECTS